MLYINLEYCRMLLALSLIVLTEAGIHFYYDGFYYASVKIIGIWYKGS